MDDGRLVWITIIAEAAGSTPATGEDVALWHEEYPHRRIPVLADLTVHTLDEDGYVAVLDAAVAVLGNPG